MRRPAAVWCFVPFVSAALAGAAGAQSAAVLGKGDADFARKLFDAGYTELASKLCDTIEKSGKASGAEKVGVQALNLDLRLDLARREPDLAKRKDLIKEVLQAKEDLIRGYQGSREAEDTENTLPDVYRMLGETLTQLVKREKDVGLVAQLQKEGHDIYTKAIAELEKRIAELETADREADPKLEQQYVNLRYNLPRTYYFQSQLYPAGEWKKGELLDKAIEAFDIFGIDYGDSFLNFEGRVVRGMCDRDLGESAQEPEKQKKHFEDALQSFDEAIGVRDFFPKDDKTGLWDLPAQAADIVSSATLQKMILLQEHIKDAPAAVAAADEYLKTTPDALAARSGLAVVAQKAEALFAAGDFKAASEAAQQLVEADERGPWGARGRELQARLIGSGGGGIDPLDTLKIAATMLARGDSEQALRIARQAVENSKGSAKAADVGAEGFLMIGAIYLQRGWLYEAALAFDTVSERWPSAEKGAEAVYRSLQVYSRLNSAEKRPTLKKKVDERMKLLASTYSASPFAASAQLVEGQDLEEAKDFLAAADLYARVQPGSSSYLEAQYRLGNAYWLQARKLVLENKAADAKQYVEQAETILRKAIQDLDREAGKTLDLSAQARLSGLSFAARTSLAQMFLLRGVDRPADVIAVLADVDDRFATDPEKVGLAWSFRIDALQAQGKFDEAIKLLDGLAKKNPDSPALGTAAGKVARALDARAQELRDKEKNAAGADEMLRRAAQYYSLSGKSLLKGEIRRSEEVASIGDRLFVLGLIFNDVPEGQGVTFVGWDPKKTREPKLWREAADLYATALRVSPSYKTEINLGRCHGFLGDYAEAATVLATLFDREQVWDGAARRFNTGALRSKPELLYAYLEWGVAEHLASAPGGELEGLTRAASVLENLVGTGGLTPTSDLWWQAKYHQCKALADAGKYTDADLKMRDAERTTSNLGGNNPKLVEGFKALKAELAQKTLGPQQQQPSPK